MIISFNPSILQSQDTDVQALLAKILVVLMETNVHFIDIKDINSVFYNQNGKYIFESNAISNYLSARHQMSLKELLSKRSRR